MAAPTIAAASTAPRSRWRTLWRWTWRGALALLVLAAVAWVAGWWIASTHLARIVATLDAAGAPRDLTTLLGPEPKPEDNGAADWQQAIARLPPRDLTDRRPTTREDLARVVADPAPWAGRLIPLQDALDAFARGAAKPVVRMPVDWTRGPELRLDHLEPLRILADLTLVRGAVALGRDPVAGVPVAVAAVGTVLDGAERLAWEPTLISGMVAQGMRARSLNLLWVLVRDPLHLDADLAPLRQRLAAPSQRILVRTLDGERLAFAKPMFHLIYRSPISLPLRCSDEAAYLDAMAHWRAMLLDPRTTAAEFLQPTFVPSATHPVTDMALPNVPAIVQHWMRMRLDMDLAMAAIDTAIASRAAGHLVAASPLPPGITAVASPRGLALEGRNQDGKAARWPLGPEAMDAPPSRAPGSATGMDETPPAGPVNF